MCTVTTKIIAGVVRVMLSGCAAEEQACNYAGYTYGTRAYVRCVQALTQDPTFDRVFWENFARRFGR